MQAINVIGGGLAGSEAAYRLARSGLKVKLYEMRPYKMTPVHRTGNMAELVCSNSLKSELSGTAQGLLKEEMKMLGSLILDCAAETRVPAGAALAVDRDAFSNLVSSKLAQHPNIEIINKEITELPVEGISIIATGPLTSDSLYEELSIMSGEENLHFFDAVAPSVSIDSLNKDKVFKASRYGKGSEDYYNCPMSKEEYDHFYDELVNADINEGHEIDKKLFFSGCMPIEVMARRGRDTLRFGPMRPVGLDDPRTGRRPWAVVQLRQENREGSVFGLVGFQTRLKWGEQNKVFRLIPGMEEAEFVRYGVMHRNTYINSPRLLLPSLQFRKNDKILFAGQITGVEGYLESAATGIIAGINALRIFKGEDPLVPEKNTLIGSLLDFISSSNDKSFQPINANFGILPALEERIKDKKKRYQEYTERSLKEMFNFSELFIDKLVK